MRLLHGTTEAPSHGEQLTAPQGRRDNRQGLAFRTRAEPIGGQAGESISPCLPPGYPGPSVPSLTFAAVLCGSLLLLFVRRQLNHREPPRDSRVCDRVRATSDCSCVGEMLSPRCPKLLCGSC